MLSSYMQALGAHINYWYDNDVGLFILFRLLDVPSTALASAMAGPASGAPTPSSASAPSLPPLPRRTDSTVTAPRAVPPPPPYSPA